MTAQMARFSLGEIVQHDEQDYRGVVIDVDPAFEGPEEWLQGEDPAIGEQPWYSLLLDNSEKMAYVPEDRLMPEDAPGPVMNPGTANLLGEFQNGRYRIRQTFN